MLQVPLEIAFHNIESSDWAEQQIRARVADLEKLYDRLVSCRVRIDQRAKDLTGTIPPVVHIELGIPGRGGETGAATTRLQALAGALGSSARGARRAPVVGEHTPLVSRRPQPHTAAGKIQKTALRERFKEFVLPTAATVHG